MSVGTYALIETVTLGSAVADVTFGFIPQRYTDLVLVVNGSPDQSAPFRLLFGNGSIDTGTNYSSTELRGDGSTASSGRSTNLGYITNGYVGSSAQCMWIINIFDYSNTTTNKTALISFRTAAASSYSISANVGLWRSTSAINYVRVSTNQSPQVFQTGTTFRLYGIEARNQ